MLLIPLFFVGIGVMFTISILVFPRPETIYSEYEGTLESIQYKQYGSGKVETTILYFEDGTKIELDGYYVYELGERYKITFKKVGLIPPKAIDVERVS